MTNTAPNVQNSNSTPTSLPSNFQTTTSAKPANLPIGTGLSSPGLATLRTLAQKPTDAYQLNHQLLASLKQDLGSRLVITNKLNQDFEVTGHEIKISGRIDGQWLKALEHYTKPSRGDFVAMEVTRLRTLTAKRKEGEFDIELSIGAITEELCDFPEDIVKTVCRETARNNVFFPALKELLEKCNHLVSPRNQILRQMREVKYIEDRKEEGWTPPSEQEKQKVSNIIEQCIKNLSAG